ncbi:cellulose binding domain-containing protein [Streptomyces sp. NPDC057654]|uniref:cellulose binding domain-containing protein n=1 Tax=Streptomyces sp. NPDC057654 TaxID=3346196 RepID=UPI0036C85781
MAIVIAAGAAAYVKWGPGGSSDSGTGELKVRYRTGGPTAAAAAKPWLEVINNSKKTVPLSDVTLRYYFAGNSDGNSDGNSAGNDSANDAAYGFNCVQTSRGCGNITQKLGTLSGGDDATATHYVEVGFGAGAGDLKPGGTSEGIGLQIYRLDHKKLNQANDRSFDAKVTHYAPSKRVTAYIRGALAWGDEPSGTADTGKNPPSSAAAAAPPAGVIFDNFHYTGADDPAFAANGWQARSDGGGPGIHNTWSADGITFPAEPGAKGGQVLQLRAATDGTKKGTKQSEIQSVKPEVFTGTIAARVYFSDKPVKGPNGDHLNESFFTISPADKSNHYSELDYEYMPHGGWGAPGPRLDTTSWRSGSGKPGDRTTRTQPLHLTGWHTMMITAMHGTVTYSVDGHKLFSHKGVFFPREPMSVHFSSWFIDLPFKGSRTWDMRVNWLYYQADRAVSLPEVDKAVDGFYTAGTNHVNTVRKH